MSLSQILEYEGRSDCNMDKISVLFYYDDPRFNVENEKLKLDEVAIKLKSSIKELGESLVKLPITDLFFILEVLFSIVT